MFSSLLFVGTSFETYELIACQNSSFLLSRSILVENGNKIWRSYEQFVGKFDTPKIQNESKFYFEIHVPIAISLLTPYRFLKMRVQNFS